MKIVVYLILALLGFAAGRIGHIYEGQLTAPHHWIWGALLIIVGIILRKRWYGYYLLSIGIGIFISDWDDFLAFRLLSPDTVTIKRFWAVD